MTNIIWDQLEDRRYEAGLDRGVLYFPDGGGVAWNGLTSVDESSEVSLEPVYFDGIKFNDIVISGDYSATLRAFTYPDEFLKYEGVLEEQRGLYITDQPQSLFHLSYRTRIGTNLDDGYKLHLLWNLTAVPESKTYETLSMDSDPIEFEWSLTSVPEPIDGYRPTAHVILDSRRIDPWMLADIEVILYGDPANVLSVPIMPSLKGFISFVRKWNRLIITDNGDGTWTAAGEENVVEMLNLTTFQITSPTAVYLNATTYTVTSSDKNEEDI